MVAVVAREEEERVVGAKLISEAMKSLTDRECRIIQERRLSDDPRTLEDLGKEYGISRERVRQIENRAFEKLQKAVKSAVANLDAKTSEPLQLLTAPA